MGRTAEGEAGYGAARIGVDVGGGEAGGEGVEPGGAEIGGQGGGAVERETGTLVEETGNVDPAIRQFAEADVGVFAEVEFEWCG